MVFSEPLFVFRFLPIVLLVHFMMPKRWRNGWLLLASLAFYTSGEPKNVVLMIGSIAANWALGVWLVSASTVWGRRGIVVIATCANVSLLVACKYLDFIVANLNPVLGRLGHEAWPMPEVALPIGISFFTFQAMSYIFDVARGNAPVQRRVIDFGLYIALFPQLIAGPIVRYVDIAEQIAKRIVTRAGFAEGVRRFVIGLAKKVLIANVVADIAVRSLAVPESALTADLAWLGVLAYSIQIYFDFSGYSDMAIGLGLMFGFRFRENFLHPYVSQSITEFWRRWHVSLSTWFRDYVYVPLGGNRHGAARTYFNLVVVFLLCGLWHGAAWNFLLWGAYHGAFLVIERLGLTRLLQKAPRWTRHAYLLVCVMVGWALFNADDLTDAWPTVRAMFGFGAGILSPLAAEHHVLLHLDPEHAWALAIGALSSIPWLPYFAARYRAIPAVAAGRPAAALLEATRLLLDRVFIIALGAACALQLAAQTQNPFIYFRF